MLEKCMKEKTSENQVNEEKERNIILKHKEERNFKRRKKAYCASVKKKSHSN